MFLPTRIVRTAVDRVVGAMMRHLLAVEQATHDLDRFRHALLADTRRVERGADRGVLGVGVTGADAELEPPIGDMVDRRHLAGEVNRMPEVVVEHERADADALGRRRHRRQRRERRPVRSDVVERAEHVEPGALGSDCDRPQVVGAVVASDLETEPKGTISARHPPIFALPSLPVQPPGLPFPRPLPLPPELPLPLPWPFELPWPALLPGESSSVAATVVACPVVGDCVVRRVVIGRGVLAAR